MLLYRLVASHLGAPRADEMFRLLVVHPDLQGNGDPVPRAVMAQALNMCLFSDLLERVPDAAAYAADCLSNGRRIFHDHGAVRTVILTAMGALPSGEVALVRILEPLGYRHNGLYPLDRLKMTGRSYAQADYPEEIAQFFVSELHVERFSPAFARAVKSVVGNSRDPLSPQARSVLARFQTQGSVDFASASAALPVLIGCFDRQHDVPSLSDYEALLRESAEMAWIATEGNAFNHATDRVADVEALSAEQRALGRRIKDTVEVSASGRVRQTAFRAAEVRRAFRDVGGNVVERDVLGSFYEFITRLPLGEAPSGRPKLDLAFDSSNAQGIFQMTSASADS